MSNRRDFLKQAGVGLAAGLIYLPGSVEAEPGSVPVKVPRSTPEKQGVDSEAILRFLEAVLSSRHEFHSLMLLRHGCVVAEGWWRPYRPASPQMLYSLSKSFTSTAIGLAVAEGRLTTKDRVVSLFPDQKPAEVSELLANLTVKDLLTMSVGHAEDSTGSLWDKADWVRQFLSLPIKHPPGTAFLYNSGATFVLSAIVQKLTGQTLVDYLRPRLFVPLGIESFDWETNPQGINTGGWGLKVTTESLARFGQLYLQRGKWNGRQLLPAAWVDEATSFKIQQPSSDLEEAKKHSDWHQGYCYQFWRCRHNAYRGDGAFGQYTVVFPQQDAVLVITSETSDMQGPLNLAYEHLLPTMKDGVLPENRESHHALLEKLNGLEIAPLSGGAESEWGGRISGKRFAVKGQPGGIREIYFRFEDDRCTFSVAEEKAEHHIMCGYGRWLDGESTMPGTPPKLTRGDLGPRHKVAGSSAWRDANTLAMRWQFYETPHHDLLTCHFQNQEVTVEFLNSIAAMGNRKDSRPPLRGILPG